MQWMGRIPELLETLKIEYERMSNDFLSNKRIMEDYEKTLKEYFNDSKNMENTINDLKNKHELAKQSYLEEINILREKYGINEVTNNNGEKISQSGKRLRETASSSMINTGSSVNKQLRYTQEGQQYDPLQNNTQTNVYQSTPVNNTNETESNNENVPRRSSGNLVTNTQKLDNPQGYNSPLIKSTMPKTNTNNTNLLNPSPNQYGVQNTYQSNLPPNNYMQKMNSNYPPLNTYQQSNMLPQSNLQKQLNLTPNSNKTMPVKQTTPQQQQYPMKNQNQLYHNIQMMPNNQQPIYNNNQMPIQIKQQPQPNQQYMPKKSSPTNNLPPVKQMNYPPNNMNNNLPPNKMPLDKAPKKNNMPPKNPKVPVLQMIKVPTQKGSDWQVKKNGLIESPLNVDLQHNIDHDSVVCCVKFSHDGKYLATGCNRRAYIYSTESGEVVHTLYDQNAQDKNDLYIRSVCFSPNGKFIATGAEDKTVKVWDIEQKTNQTFNGHNLDIYSLDFSPDGRIIASGSGDKKVKVWNVEENKCCYTFGDDELGPKDGVTSVAISPDGRLVAAGSLDKIVRIWDLSTGFFLERYEGHEDSVYSVSFSPDGKTLVSGSLDKTLKIWDLSGGRSRAKCVSSFEGHNDFVLSVAFSKDARWIVSGSKDRNIIFWDPRTTFPHLMLQGHRNSVISVDVSPVSKLFASGSGDFRSRIWNYT